MEHSAQPDPAKTNEIAQKVFALLVNEESATRHRILQAVMLLLGETPLPESSSNSLHATGDVPKSSMDLGDFFNRKEKTKPSDHAQLAAAYHYSQYGFAPFSLEDIRKIATEAGVVLPDRLDMTFNAAPRVERSFSNLSEKECTSRRLLQVSRSRSAGH